MDSKGSPTEPARTSLADRPVLEKTLGFACDYLDSLTERPVRARASVEELRSTLGPDLTERGVPAAQVIDDLARAAEPGLVPTSGPRFFGFVVGATLPVTLAADWLTSTWDQNAGLYALSPAASVVEEVASRWLLDLLGLPATASVGFVTGCQMANFVGLAAGRHAVLARAGWNVEEDGLQGAPRVEVVAGAEAHVTIFTALRMLGLGSKPTRLVEADGQGRLRPDALRRVLAQCQGPTLVCAQAGNVNTGAVDPLEEIAALTREHGAWLHVDGAFGLWAAASPSRRGLLRGAALADSWATDAHKWLNVPYDCGLVVVADPQAHRGAMSARASYLVQTAGAERDPFEYGPEFSRRARGFTVYAALRHLGRQGVAEVVERACRVARLMAERLSAAPGVRVLNEVVLNQVLVRFEPPGGGDADAFTRAVIARVQQGGVCWLGGTRWRDQEAMRISVSGWATTEADGERSAEAILAAAREAAR
jgi:glutamate/tyrosine decarboxylase-like PLP-dependent enzyme